MYLYVKIVQREVLKCIYMTLVLFRDVLGKSINTDEAAALGAVYHAADLGKGFKVKKFLIKDACHYPIVVSMDLITVFI